MSVDFMPLNQIEQVARRNAALGDAAWQWRRSTCSVHGYEVTETYVPSLDYWTHGDCPACKRQSETGEPQPKEGQSMKEFRLSQAGIPSKFLSVTMADFPVKDHQDAHQIAEGFKAGEKNLVIVGPLGSGRTRLACALLAECATKGRVEYHSAAALSEYLWSAERPHDGSYSMLGEALKGLSESEVLCIDDLHELNSPDVCGWIQRLLTMRRHERRSTILIASDLSTVGNVLGSRTLDEIRGSWLTLVFGQASQ